MSKVSDRHSILIGSTIVAAAVAAPAAAARVVPLQPARLKMQQPVLAERHYGKYRGTVVNNTDPQQRGRIMATVPAVLGLTPSGWALPCAAGAGSHTGVLAVPPVGAAVWVEFEGGDANLPIWSGGFWPQAADVPSAPNMAAGMQNIVLATQTASLTIDDLPGPSGGIVLKSPTGATIAVNDSGIFISNGKGATIVMVGPTVTINTSHVFT